MRHVGKFDADDAELERVLFPNGACRADAEAVVRLGEERVIEFGFLPAAQQREFHLLAGPVVGERDADVERRADGRAVNFQKHVAGLHARARHGRRGDAVTMVRATRPVFSIVVVFAVEAVRNSSRSGGASAEENAERQASAAAVTMEKVRKSMIWENAGYD